MNFLFVGLGIAAMFIGAGVFVYLVSLAFSKV